MNYILKNKDIFLTLFVFCISIFTAINKIPRLVPFEDEIIALTSHLNFFNDLSFDSPFESGVGVSSRITTGFNASIGGSLAWLATKSFFYSRLFNFIWFVLIANLLKIYLYKKQFFNHKKTIFILNLAYLTIPWWYGALYGLGEMISSVIFFYSIFIFQYNNKLALFLISISIFYGKFILIISAAVFLLLNFKDALKNLAYLLFPQILWYLVIIFNKGLKGFLEYFIDFFSFASFHGLLNNTSRTNQNILIDLLNSEIMTWPISIKLRVIVVPILISLGLLIKGTLKTNIFDRTFNLVFPLLIFANHIYFFFFSYKKYLRYSQVTLVITVLLMIVAIDKYSDDDKEATFFCCVLFSLFLSNFLILALFNILLFLIYFLKKDNVLNLLLVFLFLNTLNINYEFEEEATFNLIHPPCSKNIQSQDCGKSFLPYLDR